MTREGAESFVQGWVSLTDKEVFAAESCEIWAINANRNFVKYS